MKNRDEVWLDLNEQLAELVHQQHHPDSRISDLGDAWDRHFDTVLAVRAEEQRMIDPPSEAEVNALHLLAGLLEDDDQASVAAMVGVLTDLDGNDLVALLLVVLRIVIRQIELDYGHSHHAVDREGHPEVDGLAVGESDFAGLAELDGDGLIDVLVNVCKMLLGVVGDRREVLRSIIRTQLQGVGRGL